MVVFIGLIFEGNTHWYSGVTSGFVLQCQSWQTPNSHLRSGIESSWLWAQQIIIPSVVSQPSHGFFSVSKILVTLFLLRA